MDLVLILLKICDFCLESKNYKSFAFHLKWSSRLASTSRVPPLYRISHKSFKIWTPQKTAVSAIDIWRPHSKKVSKSSKKECVRRESNPGPIDTNRRDDSSWQRWILPLNHWELLVVDQLMMSWDAYQTLLKVDWGPKTLFLYIRVFGKLVLCGGTLSGSTCSEDENPKQRRDICLELSAEYY